MYLFIIWFSSSKMGVPESRDCAVLLPVGCPGPRIEDTQSTLCLRTDGLCREKIPTGFLRWWQLYWVKKCEPVPRPLLRKGQGPCGSWPGLNSEAHDVSWHWVSVSHLFFLLFHLFICVLAFPCAFTVSGMWQLSVSLAYLLFIMQKCIADEVPSLWRSPCWEPGAGVGSLSVFKPPAWGHVPFCVALCLLVYRFPLSLPWPAVLLTGTNLGCKLMGCVFFRIV